ncbi:MAG: phosphatidylserine decarboxylase [Bdellovibrio sp.]|nr:phosphatidylserine decarboxylase [Bdellovibrio sp.]
MRLSTRANKYFAIFFWNLLPTYVQKLVSFLWSFLYRTRASTVLIKIFESRYQLGPKKMRQYAPASGALNYLSFQDFFTRKLVQELKVTSTSIMPCEGVVCENGLIKDLNKVNVKGQFVSIRNIFGDFSGLIPETYSFVNIFLHNHNYHRFHAPITGVIKNMIVIPGQLNFLRPWLYNSKQISEPAIVNERVVIEVTDDQQRSWFISFVGGMGVGQIKIHDQFQVGKTMNCGDEIGLFLMGSTCCLAIPKEIKTFRYLEKVSVGDSL